MTSRIVRSFMVAAIAVFVAGLLLDVIDAPDAASYIVVLAATVGVVLHALALPLRRSSPPASRTQVHPRPVA